MSPIIRRILQLLVIVAVQVVLLFVSAGTLQWRNAWWYLGLYFGMMVLAAIVMIPRRPEVVAERARGTEGAKPWDKVITRLVAIPSLGLLILAGLDERFGWTAPLPAWVFLLGVLLFVAGYALVLWAMYSNPFFAQIVRIQTERNHAAVTSGPYRIIRHPGYAGMLLSFAGCVFILDSLYGLLLYLFFAGLVILRTALEDRTLLAELPGYAGFSSQTRYRILPGIW